MATETKELQTRTPSEVEAPEPTREQQTFSPRADVFETGDSIVIIADMPGVEEDGVEITLEKNILTIAGHVPRAEREGYRLAYEEYVEGDYERSFALSEGVDRDGIEATVSNGVLRLNLPKVAEAAARKIPVRAG